ncbi:MAG: iron-sulfur cluster assembly scaffold protein, partial [Bacillota bacterium]|nr:iron-sulfur cluster assembly scaffold protein [Bacillota bacterium]
ALDGLPPAKIHCSVLAEEAVKTAIDDYYKRQGIDKGIAVECTGCCENCEGHKHEEE